MGEHVNFPERLDEFKVALSNLKNIQTATGLNRTVVSLIDTPVTYRLENLEGTGLQVAIGDFRFLGVEREAITRFIRCGQSGYHLSATGVLYLDQQLWDTYVLPFAQTGHIETEMADVLANVIGDVLHAMHNVGPEFLVMLNQKDWLQTEENDGVVLSFFTHIPVEQEHYLAVMETVKLNLQAASCVPIAVETEHAMAKAMYSPGNSTLN